MLFYFRAQEGNPTLFVRTIDNVLKNQDKSDKLGELNGIGPYRLHNASR